MIDDLEKKLYNLPKRKLGLAADLKIKLAIYYCLFKQIIKNVFSNNWQFLNYKLATVIIILMTGSAIGAFYIYQDRRITSEHKLYPVKQTLEAIEESFTFSPAAKIELYDKFSEKRLQEALYLSENQGRISTDKQKELEKDIDETINRALTNLDLAADFAVRLPDNKKTKQAERTVSQLNSAVKLEILDKIEIKAKQEDNQPIAEKARAAKEEVIKLKKIIEGEKRRKKESSEIINKDRANKIKSEEKNQNRKGSQGEKIFTTEEKDLDNSQKEENNNFKDSFISNKNKSEEDGISKTEDLIKDGF